MDITHFKAYTKQDILSLTRLRRFETKVGERVQILADAAAISESIKNLSASYVIIGVPEDIGVQANYGTPGTSTAWFSFLQSFLNIQSNDFLSGEDVAVIGYFDFGDVQFL